MSLNKNLLRSLNGQEGLPNPSIHLALRLSNYHNLFQETEYLNRLKSELHNDIQKYGFPSYLGSANSNDS